MLIKKTCISITIQKYPKNMSFNFLGKQKIWTTWRKARKTSSSSDGTADSPKIGIIKTNHKMHLISITKDHQAFVSVNVETFCKACQLLRISQDLEKGLSVWVQVRGWNIKLGDDYKRELLRTITMWSRVMMTITWRMITQTYRAWLQTWKRMERMTS